MVPALSLQAWLNLAVWFAAAIVLHDGVLAPMLQVSGALAGRLPVPRSAVLLIEGGLLVGQPLRVQRQVAPVGGQRVARQAVLQPQGVHKGVDGVQTGSKHPKTIACIACIQLHRHKKAARRRLVTEAVAFIPASASA